MAEGQAPRAPGPSRRRGLRRKLGLLLVSVCVGLLLAEAALRLLGVTRPTFFAYHAQLGWAPRPHQRGWQRHEGEAWIEINSAGYRDKEHPVEKPPGTFRIAVLGDSFTDALQVPVEVTYWWQLEQKLGACPRFAGSKVEVLNFGVRGYSTAQELLTWRLRVRAHRPDLVILAYYPENDLVENTPALSAKGSLAPFFVYRGDELSMRESTAGGAVLGVPKARFYDAFFAARDHARILQLISDDGVYRRYRDRVREKHRYAGSDDALLARLVVYKEAYLEPADPVLLDAWRVTEGLIGLLFREVGEGGGRFGVVTTSTPIQVYPDPKVRAAFAERAGAAGLFYSEQRIQRLGERLGFPVLALGPVFQRHADEHGRHLHGFAKSGWGIGHWNADGHRLAADALAGAVCDGWR